MTEDEKRLYNLVVERLQLIVDGERSDVEAIRMLVDFAKNIFPPQFVDVLYDRDDETYGRFPNARITSLIAILDTYGAVPEALKTARYVKQATEAELDPTFSLGAGELAKVLQLCTAIRDAIFQSSVFDVPHKRRLLNRVAAIEREVHLPKGRLDVILGGVSDVGEALGKFGKDVKPLVDRMKEIAGIARGKSEEYEQLPPPEEVKRLPPPEDSEGNGG